MGDFLCKVWGNCGLCAENLRERHDNPGGAMAERTYDILDRPDILSVMFHPRPDMGPPRLAQGVHTVRIPVDDDIAVGGKIYTAGPGAPVILYFHGNGEIASDYDYIAPLYLSLGLTLFVIDYRGYGMSSGSPTASALVNDAWTCFEKTPEVLAGRGIDAGPIYLMGRSMGSAAVLEIAARAGDDIAGLIIESGFAYTFALIERLGFIRVAEADEDRDGFGNLGKISRVTVPTLVIHGMEDWIIPISDGLALHDASPAADKRLVTVPGAGHNDLMLVGREPYFEAIADLCAPPA